MVSLAFAVACSSTFPVLILALYWRGLTTLGAVAGGTAGLMGALVLTVIGPAVWVKVLGHAAPLFPLDPPALVTLPLAFATCWLVSRRDRSHQGATDRARFDAQNHLAAVPAE
jgi:cation/acetate symporter